MTDQRIGDTAATIEGEGPPVILIHGMGLNRRMWEWQLSALTPLFRTIRYDLLGHGESDKPVKRYEMAHLVDQAARLMDGLKLDRCPLVGFSLGGMIAEAFALAHPDRVSAIAVLNSAYDRSSEQRAGMMQRLELMIRSGLAETTEAALARWFTAEFASRRPDVIDRVRQWMLANDPEVYPLVYRVLAEGDAPLAGLVGAIRCPTLVLACQHDQGNSPAMARRLADHIPHARVAIVPGLRHMGLVEDPAAISRIVVPFLESAPWARPAS